MYKFLLSIALHLLCYTALCCDCDRITTFTESDIAFLGTVDSIYQSTNVKYYSITVVFRDVKFIKGSCRFGFKNRRHIAINIPCLNVSCCGLDMKIGETYKVAANYTKEKVYYTDDCFATQQVMSTD